MNNREKESLTKMLEQVKSTLGIKDNIKLVLFPMKYKVASISLKSKTLRLNKNVIGLFADDEIKYILTHELIHIKLATLNHGEEFYRFIHILYPPDTLEKLENRIVKKLVSSNMKSKRWLT